MSSAPAAPSPTTTATPPPVDPADFITELHAEGQFPVTAGGDPAVPDNLGSDPAAWAAEYVAHAARRISAEPLTVE